jgi:hypothetical protein
MNKIELQKFVVNQLNIVNGKLKQHILNSKPVSNPLYMIEPNQHETIFNDLDNEVYHSLDSIRNFLSNELKNI